MYFEFLACIQGGRGDEVWDNEITVSGEDMTISQALDEVEEMISGDDASVVSIEQVD